MYGGKYLETVVIPENVVTIESGDFDGLRAPIKLRFIRPERTLNNISGSNIASVEWNYTE